MPELLKFDNTGAQERKVLEITSFAGVDLSSAPGDISKNRSPYAPNMMPDNIGNPIKRTGFLLYESFGERINGVYKLGEHRIVHAGTKLYLDGAQIRDGLNDEISSAEVVGEKLWLFDGKEALAIDENGAVLISDIAYVPTVLISKNADFAEREIMLAGDGYTKKFALEYKVSRFVSAKIDGTSTAAEIIDGNVVFDTAPGSGTKISVLIEAKQEPGGSIKEEFNLISRRWKESFLCDTGTESVFTLSKTGLSDGKIKAFIMDEEGNFIEKIEGTDFTADREQGKIMFESPVPKTPITGTDNLIIEAEKDFDGYFDKVNLCRMSIAFDTGGTANRIFISGNPNEPEVDRWCFVKDPTYWPDIYYSSLGAKGSEIIGYSVMENLLATYISGSCDGRSIVIRNSYVDESGNVSFPIERHLQGEEAAAKNSFVFMDREQLFLTNRGVYAITAEDVTGEKYTQNRSYFINKALCSEENIENAFCAKWRQFYVIAINGKLYLLDTGKRSYQKGEPLSDFQYEAYFWTGIDARVLWEDGGKLFFGNEKGEICCFSDDVYSDYSEEGEKRIEAVWTFPDFFGERFFLNKTVKAAAIQAAPYPKNKIRLEYQKGEKWKVLAEWAEKISYFTWKNFSWNGFTWNGDSTPRTVTLKTKIKKFDKCKFRIVCDEPGMAFGLYSFAIEFMEKGRYKK